jgi:hypothetical protein
VACDALAERHLLLLPLGLAVGDVPDVVVVVVVAEVERVEAIAVGVAKVIVVPATRTDRRNRAGGVWGIGAVGTAVPLFVGKGQTLEASDETQNVLVSRRRRARGRVGLVKRKKECDCGRVGAWRSSEKRPCFRFVVPIGSGAREIKRVRNPARKIRAGSGGVREEIER